MEYRDSHVGCYRRESETLIAIISVELCLDQPIVLAQLLKLYGSLDGRALKLGVLFKHWAKVTILISVCVFTRNVSIGLLYARFVV